MFWPHYAIAKGVASVLAEFNQGTWNFNNDNAYIIYVAPEYPHVLATVVSAAHIMLFTLEMEEGENNQWHVASVSPTGALRHYFEGVEYLVGGDFDEDQTSQNLGGLKYSLGKRTQSAISEGGDSPARDRMYLKLPGGESYPAPLQDTEPANQ
ncbi:hypothetical protein [Spartinivicinus poritis]|uniref:Uncharacterized protein n=1 Tax=Spartinivicinus poritis TaxID=2994640 RepID=A0ABT5UI17_9GAMM|nr:hypothetical protein [Spartinivicinus sp. A2-2]MDE1466038.1 hypothetical protein [Spartinivicinus sp. A2-2]